MTQPTDGNVSIQNQTFASFRSDLNNVIESLVTNHSGTGTPTTNYQTQFWADTTTNLLKLRNTANTSYQTVGRLNANWFGILPTDIGGLTAASNLNDVASKDSARLNLGITDPSYNYFLNGEPIINQRGITVGFTDLTVTRGVDRYYLFANDDGGTVATATLSQQTFTPGQTAVPGEPRNFLRINNTTQGSSLGVNSVHFLASAIEDVRTLAGQTVTFSFWARSTISTKSIVVDTVQQFGSGGSAAVGTTIGTFTLSSTWTKFSTSISLPSISGKTIGAGNLLEVRIFFQGGSGVFSPAVTWQGTGDTEFTDFKLELGSVATPIVRRPFNQETALCQRYYEKVNHGAKHAGRAAAVTVKNTFFYKVPKRIGNPTLTTGNNTTLAGTFSSYSDITSDRAAIIFTQSAGGDADYVWETIVDAEL